MRLTLGGVRWRWLGLVLVGVQAGGCGEAAYEEPMATEADLAMAPRPAPAPAARTEEFRGADRAPAAGGMGAVPPMSPVVQATAASQALHRKIIYQAEISLTIESLDVVEPQVLALVKGVGGYVSDYSISGSPGSLRSARWQVRVPVDTFDGFVVDVAKLGELQQNRRTSQDVTADYVDLQARVKNKRVEEERIVKLLEERTGRLEDIIQIEGELSRVRGEIEQMEGRQRLLEDQTSLSTVTIQVQERSRFEPAPPVAATFGTRVQRTFDNSYQALKRTGENVALVFVALAPWLPILLVGLVVAAVLVRWAYRLGRRIVARAIASRRRAIAPG